MVAAIVRGATISREFNPMTYSNLAAHASMIFDETRNSAYLAAMQAHIGPDTVVLDLGAGLGVLGLLAAKAGARRVYCVEPSPVARHIQALAEANGVADRITVIRSRIEQAELPEQVDLLLSVFTGNLLFTEGLLPSLYFARDRYLKPGGIMLPDRARLMLRAVDAGEHYLERVGRFRQASLGVDYSPLVEAVANQPAYSRRDPAMPAPMSPPVAAIELDFTQTRVDSVAFDGVVQACADGTVNALLGWIEIRLGEAWLSTAPGAPKVHWSPGMLPLVEPVAVMAGETLGISYRFIDDERLFWSVRAGERRQTQSTVMHDQELLIDMQLSAPECVAPLSEDGRVVAEVLAAISAGSSNRIIAQQLLARYPARYVDAGQATKAVGRLAARHRSHPARDA